MEYRCNICDKKYKSYKSLWNHNKNFHKKNIKKIQNIHSEYIQSDIQNIHSKNIQNKCIKCNKILCNYYSKWRHEKNCNGINKLENTEIQEIKKENIEIKKEMEKLKKMLQKAMKIHPKTLTKINNQLNNYGTINNINIIQLGHENLSDILTEKEKIRVLDRQAMSINV